MLPVDLKDFIETIGYIGIFAIIFSETGLMVGFFLPGDSLLFTAGFLASQDILNIWVLIPVCFAAAITGNAVGYFFGKRVGRKLFRKPESRFFKPENLVLAEAFFERHGGKAIILAQFVPFARTFVPIVAGISKMRYRVFAAFNIVGALLWAVGLPLAGYYLGHRIPNIDKYLLPVILIIVLTSLIPSAFHLWREHGRDIVRATRHQFTTKFGRGESGQ